MANTYCPICKEENGCMLGSEENGSCWCNLESFPKEIFEMVPLESNGKQCICKKCLQDFNKEQPMKKNNG